MHTALLCAYPATQPIPPHMITSIHPSTQAYLIDLPPHDAPHGSSAMTADTLRPEAAGNWLAKCSNYNTALKSYSWTSLTPPSTINWAPYTTPIRNQGGCGSCAAFAATATIETSFIVSWANNGFTRTNTDLSEQDFLDCTTNNQCTGGW